MEQKPLSKESWILIIPVLVKLFIHLFTNAFASYGMFRDELYYLACSHRLDLGYVDQPPLSIYVLALSRILFGDSLFALRLVPALAGAATVLVTGLIVRRLGGGAIASVIACLAMVAAPIHLGMNTVYSMNSLDILLWTLAAYVLVLLTKEDKPSQWILLGVIIGLGLLNKISMAWFAIGLFLAVVLTKLRKALSAPWPYVAGLIAFGLFLPYIVWNLMNDFAHLEFIRNATTWKYAGVTSVDFIAGQLIISNPATLPLWLAGFYYYFFSKDGKSFMMLGIIFVTAFLILVVNVHSKPEYLSPAYPILFAAGGVQLESLSRRKPWAWMKYALPAVIVVTGSLMAPIVLPFLPIETHIRYRQAAGIAPQTSEGHELGELDQFFADMFGWENKARTVSEVYTSLPEGEKSKTVIYARNYGEAGAVEYYSREYELPPVISSHNNYWIWAWEHKDRGYQTVIVIGGEEEDHLRSCGQVEQVSMIRCRYCMPYENNLPVFICRELKRNFEEILSSDKHFG